MLVLYRVHNGFPQIPLAKHRVNVRENSHHDAAEKQNLEPVDVRSSNVQELDRQPVDTLRSHDNDLVESAKSRILLDSFVRFFDNLISLFLHRLLSFLTLTFVDFRVIFVTHLNFIIFK